MNIYIYLCWLFGWLVVACFFLCFRRILGKLKCNGKLKEPKKSSCCYGIFRLKLKQPEQLERQKRNIFSMVSK